jgi:hypothetical protein
MRSHHPDVLNVSSGPEKIILSFGSDQTSDVRQDAETHQFSDRIVMSPFTAKGLATVLNEVISEYESKYGCLDMKPSPTTEPDQDSSIRPDFSRTKISDEKVGLLLQLVKNLNVEVGFERSFKIVNEVLLDNRFLLGADKKEVGRRADDRLTEMCSLMGMPKTLLDVFKHHLPQGHYVHFGFEQNEKTSVYKVYLEFWEKIKKEISKSKHPPGSALLHLGLKWDVSDPAKQSITHYTWYPWISPQEVLQRVTNILHPQTDAPSKQAADELVSLALARIPYRDILYLEVTEEGNPRRSFDINVYRANLQVAEIYPLLSMLCRRHSVPFETFHSLYDGIKRKRFGHLSGGVDREGNNFFTIYYGVEALFDERSKELLSSNGSVVGPTRYSLPARRRRMVRVEETDGKAKHLFRLAKGLGLKGAFERSFKFLDRILLTDRFLIAFRKTTTNKEIDAAIMDICRQIDMPQEYQEMFRAELHEARHVLFAFEKNEKNSVYKAYLEFSGRLTEALREEPRPESVVIHTGFKWDASDNSRKVVATYKAFHVLRARDIAARVFKCFFGSARKNPYRIVDDILDLAGSRTQPGELLYFEASEENNLRRSFDINMYRANLQMAEIYPLLVDMARHYSVEMEQFDELYEAVKTQKFGHLSGGTDREGRDFLTVYFSKRKYSL